MVFIDNFSVRNRSLSGVPDTIVITLSSGDEVEYVRKVHEMEEVKLQLLPYITFPKCEFGKFNPDDYDIRDKYAVCIENLDTMMKKFKCSLEEAGRCRDKLKSEIDCQYENWEENLREDYRNQRKKWEILMGQVENPEGRIRMVVKELEKSNLESASSVIKILELETDFIAKTMKTMDLRIDTFLSNVQSSGDLCGRLSNALSHAGLTCWYDMNSKKLDTQGIIQGVLNSKVFTVVLTKDYFEREWCLLEYSIALLADKPMVGIYEADKRFDGGDLNELNIPKQFKQLMNHEIIKIDSRRWNPFFSSFEETIKARRSITSVFTYEMEGIKRNSNILTKNSNIKFLISRLKSSGWSFGTKLFSSREDCANVQDFHDKCDDKGATLTVVKRKSGIIFGGFTPIFWGSSATHKYVEEPTAWLFDLADHKAPKVLDRSIGQVITVLVDRNGPRIHIKLPHSKDEIGFGLNSLKSGRHYIHGPFAGNNVIGWKRTEIEEYEVFQMDKTVTYRSV